MDRDTPHIVDVVGSARLVQAYLEGARRRISCETSNCRILSSVS